MILSDCAITEHTQSEHSLVNTQSEDTALLDGGVQIELGAYGKGYGSFTRTLNLTNKEVHCIILNPDPLVEDKTYHLPIDSTQLKQIFSRLTTLDFTGSKNYYNQGTRDGGYLKITTPEGDRTFVNVFNSQMDWSNVRPDTLGLYRYEALWREASKLVRD